MDIEPLKNAPETARDPELEIQNIPIVIKDEMHATDEQDIGQTDPYTNNDKQAQNDDFLLKKLEDEVLIVEQQLFGPSDEIEEDLLIKMDQVRPGSRETFDPDSIEHESKAQQSLCIQEETASEREQRQVQPSISNQLKSLRESSDSDSIGEKLEGVPKVLVP